MLFTNVQSIDLLMDCTAWQFWTVRQSNPPTPQSICDPPSVPKLCCCCCCQMNSSSCTEVFSSTQLQPTALLHGWRDYSRNNDVQKAIKEQRCEQSSSQWWKWTCLERPVVCCRTVARMSQQGDKNHKGWHILMQCCLYAATAMKKVVCDMLTLFILNTTQKVIQVWIPNVLSTVIWCFATWARKEIRNSIFWKLLKLLSPCRLFSLFTFAPRPLFHV